MRKSSADTQAWIAQQTGDPLDLFLKFETVGFHPIEGGALNVVEQINQTWTYVVALTAARQLLELHPEAGGFHLAPGAHAEIARDIMSVAAGLVGAETFAAVDPRNNRKLEEMRRLRMAERVGFEPLRSIENTELSGLALPHAPAKPLECPGRGT